MTDGENKVGWQSKPNNYVCELVEMDFEAFIYVLEAFKCLIFIYRLGSYICKVSFSVKLFVPIINSGR